MERHEEQKFQVNTEQIRVAELTPSLQGYLAEQALSEWYKSKFGSNNVQSIGATHDIGSDIIVRLASDKRIGVQVRSTSISGFRQIRNQIAHGIDVDRFVPRNVQDFTEYHLAIVLRDYIAGVELPYAMELNALLTGLNPNIRLIVGYIDENNQFIQITSI